MIETEPCGYWLLASELAKLHDALQTRDRAAIAASLFEYERRRSRTDVDSVLIAEIVGALGLHGSFGGQCHSLGNAYRGFPGTVLFELSCEEAHALARSGIVSKVQAEDLVLFGGDTRKLAAGLRYLTGALTLEVPFVALIFRLN